MHGVPTCIVDREDPISFERENDSVSIKCALLFEEVLRTCPAQSTVKRLKYPDISISLGTGEVCFWLLGVEEVEDLDRGG